METYSGGEPNVPSHSGYVSGVLSPEQMGHITRQHAAHGKVYKKDYPEPHDTTLQDIRKSDPYVYRHGEPGSPHVMWSPEEHRSFFYGRSGERLSSDITFQHSATFHEEGEPHELEHGNHPLTPIEGYH